MRAVAIRDIRVFKSSALLCDVGKSLLLGVKLPRLAGNDVPENDSGNQYQQQFHGRSLGRGVCARRQC